MEQEDSDEDPACNPWEGLDNVPPRPAALRCSKHGYISCNDCAHHRRFPYHNSEGESMCNVPGHDARMNRPSSILNHNPAREEFVPIVVRDRAEEDVPDAVHGQLYLEHLSQTYALHEHAGRTTKVGRF